MLLDRRALLLAGLTLPTLARAQTAWKPERPVRLILPFTPGTSMDPVARLAQESLKETLGQSVVVENIAGAATVIAGSTKTTFHWENGVLAVIARLLRS